MSNDTKSSSPAYVCDECGELLSAPLIAIYGNRHSGPYTSTRHYHQRCYHYQDLDDEEPKE